jgi:predicted permease
MGVIAPLLVVATVGSTVTLTMLAQEGWVLIAWSFIFISVCFVVSLLVAKVTRIHHSFRDEFVMACTFPNALAAPLVMMTTLCRQEPFVDEDFRADDGAETVRYWAGLYCMHTRGRILRHWDSPLRTP